MSATASEPIVPESSREVKRLRDLKSGVRDLIMLDPKIIRIEPGHNARDYTLKENRDHLDSLKKSIAAYGVLLPVLVRYNVGTKEAILVDGECRLRAVLENIAEGAMPEDTTIGVVQVSAGNEVDRAFIQRASNSAKNFSKWEDGELFNRLVRFGRTPEMIAATLGLPERYVEEAMLLGDAPEAIKVMLSKQAIVPAFAVQHLRSKGDGATDALQAEVDTARAAGITTPVSAKTAKKAKAIVNGEPKAPKKKGAPVAGKAASGKSRVDAGDAIGEAAEALFVGVEWHQRGDVVEAVVSRDLLHKLGAALYGVTAPQVVAIAPES